MLPSFSDLMQRATQRPPSRIVVAAANDPEAITAMHEAHLLGFADAIYVGDRDAIRRTADQVSVTLDDSSIVPIKASPDIASRAVALIRGGEGDLLMKGNISTSALLRAVLDRQNGLRSDGLLSQVIAFSVPSLGRMMLMTDAAINIAPDLARKADICRNAISVAHALGNQSPKTALLCALEFVNPDMPATIDAAALTMMNRRGQIADAVLDGPIALDAALSAFAAERKGIRSELVADTDILVAPSIEAANILYRAICYMASGESGGIVVGASVPLILLSRAESAETKLHSIALAKVVVESSRKTN